MGKLPFLKGNKIYSHFDGSNNIFADCTPEFGKGLNIVYDGYLNC